MAPRVVDVLCSGLSSLLGGGVGGISPHLGLEAWPTRQGRGSQGRREDRPFDRHVGEEYSKPRSPLEERHYFLLLSETTVFFLNVLNDRFTYRILS